MNTLYLWRSLMQQLKFYLFPIIVLKYLQETLVCFKMFQRHTNKLNLFCCLMLMRQNETNYVLWFLYSVLQGTLFFIFIFNVYVTGAINTALPREREHVMHARCLAWANLQPLSCENTQFAAGRSSARACSMWVNVIIMQHLTSLMHEVSKNVFSTTEYMFVVHRHWGNRSR